MNYSALLYEFEFGRSEINECFEIVGEVTKSPKTYSLDLVDSLIDIARNNTLDSLRVKNELIKQNVPLTIDDGSLMEKCQEIINTKILPKLAKQKFFKETSNPFSGDLRILKLKSILDSLSFLDLNERNKVFELFKKVKLKNMGGKIHPDKLVSLFNDFLENSNDIKVIIKNKLKSIVPTASDKDIDFFLKDKSNRALLVSGFNNIRMDFLNELKKNPNSNLSIISSYFKNFSFLSHYHKDEIETKFLNFLTSKNIQIEKNTDFAKYFNDFINQENIPSFLLNKNEAFQIIKKAVPTLDDSLSANSKEKIFGEFINFILKKEKEVNSPQQLADQFRNFIFDNKEVFEKLCNLEKLLDVDTNLFSTNESEKKKIINSFSEYLRTKRKLPTDKKEAMDLFSFFISSGNYRNIYFVNSHVKKIEFKKKVWKILLVLLLILLTIVLFIYIKNKIKFKEMYTIKDLLKDIWKKIKSISAKVYEKTIISLYKIAGTIIALSLILIIVYFASKFIRINVNSFPIPAQILFKKFQEKVF